MNAPVSTNEDLIYAVTDGIARMTFNRPQARNALTFAMYEQMASICESINADRSIKALIITGAGDKAFASGTDISQFRAFKTAQDSLDYEARIDRVLGTLEQCRVPVIAAIAGACTGGGAGIAACCDIRIGTETTRIGFPIARTLGNCLSMSNISRLVSLIGPARTKDLIFKARLVEAAEALALGLLNEVVPDVATLQRRADETAKLVAGHAPITLEVTKEAVRRIRRTLTRDEGEDLILRAYMREDFREGMDAFLNKRTPNWKGQYARLFAISSESFWKIHQSLPPLRYIARIFDAPRAKSRIGLDKHVPIAGGIEAINVVVVIDFVKCLNMQYASGFP